MDKHNTLVYLNELYKLYKGQIMFYFSHEKTKTMVEIHKFVFSMIQFISLFLITIEVGRCKSCFHPFQIFFFAL